MFCKLPTASAQRMQWSNTSKLKGAEVFTKVLGENKHGVFLLRYRNRFYTKGIIIEKYSHLLSLDKSEAIELRKARLVKLYLTPKGLILIKNIHDRKKQVNRLVAQKYTYSLEKDGSEVELISVPITEFGDRGDFRLRITDNLEKIVILQTVKDTDSAHTLRYIYDAALQLKQKNRYSWSVPREVVLKDVKVYNSGAAVLLTEGVARINRKRTLRVHTLYHIADTGITPYSPGDSVYMHSPSLVYHRAEDRISLVSFYINKKEYGLAGTCYYRWQQRIDSGRYTWGPFGEYVTEQLKVNERNDGHISEGFELLRYIPRSDGGMLLVAEQKEIATQDDIIMVNGLPQTSSKNIYNFNEILVLNYDDSAFLDWHKLITKNQTTVNDGGYYSSVVIYTGPKYVQLLYNDQLRSSGDVVQFTIYNNGKEESRKLLKSELDYIAIVPSEASQVSSNKVIIPTSKNRRFALLKLVYP